MHFARVSAMKNIVGASPYGGDLNKWPSRLVDAFILLQEENSRVDSLMYAVEPHKDSK